MAFRGMAVIQVWSSIHSHLCCLQYVGNHACPRLKTQTTQLSCKRCVKVVMYRKCEKSRHDCYRYFLPKDRFGDSGHEEPDQDVGNRLCQETWWSCSFSRLVHDHRFHHCRWPAAIVGKPRWSGVVRHISLR